MDIDDFLDKELSGIGKEPATAGLVKKEFGKYEKILDGINKHIQKNELVEAEKLYSRLWHKITDEKLTWDESLCISLTEINKRLIGILVGLSGKIKEKTNIIDSLMAKVRNDLKKGKTRSAVTAYSEIIETYDGFPDVFLVDKRGIHNEILMLYRELKQGIEKNFFQDLDSKVVQIRNFIYSTETELQRNNFSQAIKYYTNCLSLYNALPSGFLMHKIQLSNKILELYKEITITLEISNLKTKIKQEEKRPLRATFMYGKLPKPRDLYSKH